MSKHAIFMVVLVLCGGVLYATPPVPSIPLPALSETSNGQVIAYIGVGDPAVYGRVFPPTESGQISENLIIQISNSGGPAMPIVSITLIGTDASQFVLDTSNTSMSVSNGSPTTFVLRYEPTTVGNHTATLEMVYRDDPIGNPTGTANYDFNISGECVASATEYLEVREASPNGTRIFSDLLSGDRQFGARVVSSEGRTLTIVFANVGRSGAGSITLGTPAFQTTTSDFTMDVSNFTTTLASGATCSIDVTFDPNTVATVSAAIEFSHTDTRNKSPFVIELQGVGVADAQRCRVCDNAGPFFNGMIPPSYTGVHFAENAAASGTPRDFANVAVGGTEVLTLTICNADVGYFGWGGWVSGADLNLSNARIVGDSAFTLDTSSFSGTVASAQTTVLKVYFHPTVPGAYSAVIEFDHDDSSERTPFRIPLVGNAVGSAGNGAGSGNDGEGCVAQNLNNVKGIGILAILSMLGLIALRRRHA